MSARVVDEHLRIRALEALGPLGEPLAREALEQGTVSVEHDVIAWEGTQGTMHGHRIVVGVEAALHAKVIASHAAVDGLEKALATAMSEQGGQAVADVKIQVGVPLPPASSPYRVRGAG